MQECKWVDASSVGLELLEWWEECVQSSVVLVISELVENVSELVVRESELVESKSELRLAGRDARFERPPCMRKICGWICNVTA